jgi:cell division protein FtsL
MKKRNPLSFSFPRFSREHASKILVVLLCTGIILFLVISSLRIEQEKRHLQERIAEIDQEIAVLQEQNEALQSGVEESRTDFFMERTARDVLGLKREGEQVVAIVFPEEEGGQEEEKGFFERLLERLGF